MCHQTEVHLETPQVGLFSRYFSTDCRPIRQFRPRPCYAGEFFKKTNGVFTLKIMHQKFFHPHYTREIIWKCNNCQPFLNFVCEKLGQWNHTIIMALSFSKSSVFKIFLSTLTCKAGIFKFPRFEEHFERLPFHDISVDSRPNHENKAVFSDVSGVMWTRP